MKTPPLAAIATILLTAASLRAELGAFATVLQPSRERARELGIPEGFLHSKVFGGSKNILVGSATTNSTTESPATEFGSMWSLELLRFNEVQKLAGGGMSSGPSRIA